MNLSYLERDMGTILLQKEATRVQSFFKKCEESGIRRE
jgi:hypothetical protein